MVRLVSSLQLTNWRQHAVPPALHVTGFFLLKFGVCVKHISTAYTVVTEMSLLELHMYLQQAFQPKIKILENPAFK